MAKQIEVEIRKPTTRRFAKTLIFGPYGSGKTTFLGTANDDPRTNPMLLLDFEGGVESLVGREIDIVEIRDWDAYNGAYAYLSQGDHPYKSVGIDSISETHIFALLEVLEKEAERRRNPDLLQQGDYGIALVQMRKLLRKFRDLDLHVFYTANDQDDLDPEVGYVKVPALAGKLSKEIPGIMDIVTYLTIGETEEGESMRVLVLGGQPQMRTKVRQPIGADIPDMIPEPTIGKLMDELKFKK